MKRFLTGCFILLILYVVAYDLKIGTLPQATPANAEIQTAPNKKTDNTFQSYEVTPGDTLISVVEELNLEGKYSIATMIADFKSLNPGVNPEHIQIGQTYKFPLYKK